MVVVVVVIVVVAVAAACSSALSMIRLRGAEKKEEKEASSYQRPSTKVGSRPVSIRWSQLSAALLELGSQRGS